MHVCTLIGGVCACVHSNWEREVSPTLASYMSWYVHLQSAHAWGMAELDHSAFCTLLVRGCQIFYHPLPLQIYLLGMCKVCSN